MLFAAVVFVLSSETATADAPIRHERAASTTLPAASGPTNSPTIARSVDRSPVSRPAPAHQPVRFSPTAWADGDQRAERGTSSQPDPQSARGEPPQRSEIQPTESQPTESQTIVPLVRPVVVLYGDSLAWEARNVFEQTLAGQPVEVVTRTFGGTAICDWHDEMTDDAATLRPGLVVIEFVGNNYTSCMQDHAGEPLTGSALVDRYAADAAAAIATFTSIDAQVVFAGAPIARPATATLDLHHAPLNVVYKELARRLDGVRYVDAGATVLDDGEWTDALPCLTFEPCPDDHTDSGAAVTAVRAPDGLHFCPASAEAARGVTGDCPVWSSGAFRFGTALAVPVLESLAATHRTPDSDA